MGKHSGPQDLEDLRGPHGTGPHPTPEESERKAQEFDNQWQANGGKK